MQDSFIGINDVQKVYNAIKTDGLTIALYGFAYLIAFGILAYNVLNKYHEITKDGSRDLKKLLDIVKPLFPYILLISALPFLISFIEAGLGLIEKSVLKVIGSSPQVDILEAWEEEDERVADINFNNLLNFDWLLGYLSVSAIKPLAVLIDNYLFSIVLSGRYVWLLLLELVAPFAIISLLNKNLVRELFSPWIKNMLKCYLLVPGFVLVHVFVSKLFSVFFDQGDYNTFVVLFLIGVKLYLYRLVTMKINTLL